MLLPFFKKKDKPEKNDESLTISTFKPYRIRMGEDAFETVEQRCEALSYECREAGLCESFSVYQKLVLALVDNPHIVVRPMHAYLNPVPESKSAISLRHDVVEDIRTGLRMARFLARYGLPGSFYLLPTAHYYGHITDRTFYRYPAMETYLRAFLVAGCEVGVINNALALYRDYDIDGAVVLEKEIKWFRSQFIRVKGTLSYPVFGAGMENFEVLKGRSYNNRSSIQVQSKVIPLQSIDESEMKLLYEANYAQPVVGSSEFAGTIADNNLARPERINFHEYWRHRTLFQPGYSTSISLIKPNQWLMVHEGTEQTLSTDELLQLIAGLVPGSRIVFVIRPLQFSGL